MAFTVFLYVALRQKLVIAGLSAGDALLRRASPLKKQSTGLFFDSPLRSA